MRTSGAFAVRSIASTSCSRQAGELYSAGTRPLFVVREEVLRLRAAATLKSPLKTPGFGFNRSRWHRAKPNQRFAFVFMAVPARAYAQQVTTRHQPDQRAFRTAQNGDATATGFSHSICDRAYQFILVSDDKFLPAEQVGQRLSAASLCHHPGQHIRTSNNSQQGPTVIQHRVALVSSRRVGSREEINNLTYGHVCGKGIDRLRHDVGDSYRLERVDA